MNRPVFRLLLIVGVILAVGASLAQVTGDFGTPPKLVPYNGVLESNGTAISGTTDLVFFVVAAPADDSTSALWTEAHPGVLVNAGNFSVVLGHVTSFGTLFSDYGELYLGITVDGTALTGRQRLMSAPYSVASGEAKDFTVSGLLTAAQLTTSGAMTVNGPMTANANATISQTMISGNYTGYADGAGNEQKSEIANDTNTYQALMLAGNRSAGGPRVIKMYETVDISGNVIAPNNVHGGCSNVQTTTFGADFVDVHDPSNLTMCPAGQFVAGIWTKHYQEGGNFRDRWVSYIRCCQL